MSRETYQIEQVKDLLLLPIESRERCVKQLLYALALSELAYGDYAHSLVQPVFSWTDDDDSSVTLNKGREDELKLEIEGEA